MLCLTLHPPGVVSKYPDGTYVSFTITKPCTFDVKVLGSCKETSHAWDQRRSQGCSVCPIQC